MLLFPIDFITLLITYFAGSAAPVARAAANLTITPVSWGVIGLDSNNVVTGPDTFMTGARVCNTGDAAATNVVANFIWTSANAYVNLAPNSTATLSRPSLAAGACALYYFNVRVTRNVAAYNTTRAYL